MYVDDLSAQDTDSYRGSPDRPGKESPFRTRSIEENLDLFVRMKNGEYPDGTRTLRAVGESRRVGIAAFLNRAAVADWLASRHEDSLIVCSGYEGIFSLEDAVCAGAVVERACAQEIPPILGDGARACLVLWERYGDDLLALLRGSGWGRHIVSIGLGPDLEICAQLDATNVVPVMAGGRIALEEPGSSLKD